jgi:hypothetical protein
MKRSAIVAAAIGSAGLVLGLSVGIGAASIPDNSGVIHGCYKPQSSGSVTPLGVIDTSLPNGHCPSSQKPLTWNQTGPQGPPGAAGSAGPSTAGASGLDVTIVIGTGNGQASASCPTDHPYVVGGGAETNSTPLSTNGPQLSSGLGGAESTSGNGWFAQEANFPSNDTPIQVWAICAK